MPTVNLSPIARRQYFDSNGDPVVGGKLFYYAAGSSTKQNTYTDSSGTVANSNPIVLDASGRTPQGVWFEAGLIYKEVLALATDTDPPTSPIYTADGLEGVNDTTTPAALASSSQWVDSGLTPTYVSATQFTLVGDQTAAFHVGRRLRLTVTAGTVYGRISVTAFGALTTVTVVLDSGALDAGLSVVDVGILTALNRSMPEPSSVGYQPLDAELTAIAGLVSAVNTVPSFTGSGTAALLTLGTATGNLPLIDGGGTVLPAGAVCHFAMSTAPTGWLKANGAQVLRSSYTALDAAIGETFGTYTNGSGAAGTTHLVLPDLRGEFIRGFDDGRLVDSARVFGSAQAQDVQPHTHTVPANTTGGANGFVAALGYGSIDGNFTSGSTGVTETRPRNIAMLACIKY